MAGFIRRYGYMPGSDIINQIEGVVIVDLPPPGSIQGVGEGVVGVVGEFIDMTFAASVDTTGTVTTLTQPVEVTSAQDMLNKLGGFDPTLGDFNGGQGNGFAAIRNKSFSRLIGIPLNLASSKAIRAYRQLPTNKSETVPTPAVAMAAVSVPAGTQFIDGSGHKVNTASRVQFYDDAAYASAHDGVQTALAATLTSAGGGFIAAGVKVGDVVVVGVLGTDPDAGTYRIAVVGSATSLTLEKMDGTTPSWVGGAAQPYRIHLGRTADSSTAAAGAIHSDASGYSVLARPLTATITMGSVLTPVVVPPTPSATSWDPLSGLGGLAHPSGDVTWTANLQQANIANNSDMSAAYSNAIDTLLTEALPAKEINILVAARQSATIRAKCKSHVLTASAQGIGRTTCISPEINTLTTAAALAAADPGVGGSRDERVDYVWPGEMTFIPEAVGTTMETATGTTTDGYLDVMAHMRLASLLSNLPPENNPGQAAPPVPSVMSTVAGFQRGAPNLAMADYILLRQNGVVALRIDRVAGPIFQSGITTSLTSGQKNIARRRMADYIEDSMAQSLNPLSKLPLTNQLKDSITAEVDAFLDGLLSPNNPAAQRISGYNIDTKSGNTPALEAAGIWVIIAKVRTLASLDDIVLQVQAGEGVVITTA